MPKVGPKQVMRSKANTIFKRTLMNALRIIHPWLKDLIREKEEYKPEVQVIHEFFDTLIERDYEMQKEKWTMLRDIICMGLEDDPAYLLRVLDAFDEIRDRGLLDKLTITCSPEYLKGHSYKFKKLANYNAKSKENEKSEES